MPRIRIAACISVLLMAAATPALAQQSRTVHYGELNLDANEGADTLIRRVEQAASIVCGDTTGPQTLREHASVGGCENDTTRAAITEIGHPVVTARYYGRRPDVIIESSAEPREQRSSVAVTAR